MTRSVPTAVPVAVRNSDENSQWKDSVSKFRLDSSLTLWLQVTILNMYFSFLWKRKQNWRTEKLTCGCIRLYNTIFCTAPTYTCIFHFIRMSIVEFEGRSVFFFKSYLRASTMHYLYRVAADVESHHLKIESRFHHNPNKIHNNKAIFCVYYVLWFQVTFSIKIVFSMISVMHSFQSMSSFNQCPAVRQLMAYSFSGCPNIDSKCAFCNRKYLNRVMIKRIAPNTNRGHS